MPPTEWFVKSFFCISTFVFKDVDREECHFESVERGGMLSIFQILFSEMPLGGEMLSIFVF